MKMCEKQHDLIVYIDYDHRNKKQACPACKVLDENARLQEMILGLLEQLGK